MVAGIGRLDGRTVALVGHQKGRDLKQRVYRNYGMAYPEGYRKAMRTMELAERHGFPVVTLVDTPGAYPGVAAEQHGQGGAIARSQAVMLRLGVPTVAVVIGEGGSGGAIAIAVADRVLMQENAIYSVISPEGCASILWRDAAQAKKAASAFKPDAAHCLELGVIDGIVPEPEGGAQEDHDAAAALLRDSVIAHLHELADASPDELRRTRRGEVPLDRRPRERLSERHALSTLSTGLSPDRKPLVCRDDDQAVTSLLRAEATPRHVRSGDGRSLGDYERKRDATPHAGAVQREGLEGRADLRHPAPRRAAAPLRPSAGAGRGACELGRPEGAAAPARRAAPRRPRRGPSARLRDLRGRHPTGPVRRRHRRDLGPRAPTSSWRRSATAASFRLAGERAEGVWTLVPARLDGKEQNWLLLRKDGSRGTRARFAAQLATPVETLPTGPEWLFEPKWDGYRAIVTVAGGDATLTSRNGTDLTERFRPVARAAPGTRCGSPEAVLDAEVCALDEDGVARFEALQSGSGPLVLMVFDLLSLDGEPVHERPLRERRELLEELIDPAVEAVRVSPAFEDGEALLEAARERHWRASSPSAPTRRTGRGDGRPSGRR